MTADATADELPSIIRRILHTTAYDYLRAGDRKILLDFLEAQRAGITALEAERTKLAADLARVVGELAVRTESWKCAEREAGELHTKVITLTTERDQEIAKRIRIFSEMSDMRASMLQGNSRLAVRAEDAERKLIAAEAKSARLEEALREISGLLCEHQIYRVECCPPCIARTALTLPEPSHEP